MVEDNPLTIEHALALAKFIVIWTSPVHLEREQRNINYISIHHSAIGGFGYPAGLPCIAS